MPAPIPDPARPPHPSAPGRWRLAGPLMFLAALALMVGALPPGGLPSRDFLALWLAGDAVASGQPGLIYPPPGALFEMRPPLDWYDRAIALGRAAPVYPYLYPPLWAWVLAGWTRLMGLGAALDLVFAINLALLAALPLLAARLAFERLDRRGMWIFATAAVLVMIATKTGVVALQQGQPQIVVAFLTLFALERAEAGRPGAAGLALGLAIALKLAPLPVVLIWLVAGRGRAALIALGCAGALGLASIAVAGWPLHLQFLAQLKAVGHTLMINLSVASMDMLYGLGLPSAQTLPMPAVPAGVATLPGGAVPGEGVSWRIAAKPAGYALAQQLIQIAVALGAGLALRFAPDRARRAAGLAAALGLLAFTGPIGWSYYYLAPQALAGLIVLRGGAAARLLLGLGVLPLAVERFVIPWAGLPPILPALASVSVAVFLLALIAVAARRRPARPA